jgi:predicted dehydrogenase
MSKINFVVVGAGYIGKRHADMILENPDSNLVGFVDIRTEEECGVEKYNVPFFRSMDDLFKSDLEFDVVNICTPNWLHSKQSIISLNNDKHVVIEKPMGLHSIESEMVIYKALQKQKNVFSNTKCLCCAIQKQTFIDWEKAEHSSGCNTE